MHQEVSNQITLENVARMNQLPWIDANNESLSYMEACKLCWCFLETIPIARCKYSVIILFQSEVYNVKFAFISRDSSDASTNPASLQASGNHCLVYIDWRNYLSMLYENSWCGMDTYKIIMNEAKIFLTFLNQNLRHEAFNSTLTEKNLHSSWPKSFKVEPSL